MRFILKIKLINSLKVFPKRCGHLDGKSLISIDDMVNKIKISAQASKECSDGSFIICARTDARGVEGIESVYFLFI